MLSKNPRMILLVAWFSLTVMACNLSSPNGGPPTVEPRTTGNGLLNATPQPTLGLQAPGTSNNTSSSSDGSEIVNVGADLSLMINEVQGDRLFSHVEALVNVRTRHVNSSQTSPNEGIGAAYRYIVDQLTQIQSESPSLSVIDGGAFQVFTGDGTASQQRNAVAVIQGTDVGAGTVVIGAHYDSRTDDLLNATAPAPGAADNGSGVAVVLEMARILSRHPQRSSIMFVLFSAEEHNRQGSKAFVRDYVVGFNIDVIAMINVDTVGSWNDSGGNINDRQIRVFSSDKTGSRQLARMAHFFGYNLDLTLAINYVDAIDREGRFGDHFSFDEQGFPAIRFIEALEDNYNREGRDTLDQIEPAYMVSATKTILGVVEALASGPRPPRNIGLRDAGNGMQSLVWEPVIGAKSYIVALRSPGSLVYNHQFPWETTQTEGSDVWRNYEGLAIAAVGENGIMGPLSQEYRIPR